MNPLLLLVYLLPASIHGTGKKALDFLPETCIYYDEGLQKFSVDKATSSCNEQPHTPYNFFVNIFACPKSPLHMYETGHHINLQDFILLKNLANFLGEEWVAGRKYQGEEIEGGTTAMTARFLLDIFRAPNTPPASAAPNGDQPAYLSPIAIDASKVLDFNEMAKFSAFLDKLPLMVAVNELYTSETLEPVNAAIALANLFYATSRDNDEWFFPVICSGVGGSHLILGSLERLPAGKVTLRIYNTGDGISYHPGMYGKRHLRRSFMRVYENMDLWDDILNTNFFHVLITFSRGWKEGTVYSADMFYQNILPRFSKYEIKYTADNVYYSIPQRAGNCYQKAFMAYIKQILGPLSFKRLEEQMRYKLTDYLLKSGMYNSSGFHCELTKRALQNTARMELRHFERGDRSNPKKYLKKFESIQNSLDSLPKCQIEADEVEVLSPKHLKDMVEGIIKSHIKAKENKVVFTEISRPEIRDSWESSKNFVEYVEQVRNYVEVQRSSTELSYYVFGMIVALPLPGASHSIYDGLNGEEIDSVTLHLQSLFSESYEKLTRSAIAAALIKLVAITWKLLTVKEKNDECLTKYNLDLGIMSNLLNSMKIQYNTPEIFSVASEAFEYIKSCHNTDKSTKKLFAGTGYKTTIRFIPGGSAEDDYLSRFELSPEQEEWFRDMIGARLGGTKSYLYYYFTPTKLVPAQFHHLRDYIYFIPRLFKLWKGENLENKAFIVRTGHPSIWKETIDIWQFTGDFFPTISCKSIDTDMSKPTETENDVLIKLSKKSLAIEKDAALLQWESASNVIDYAFYCLEKYTGALFEQKDFLDAIFKSFLSSNLLQQWARANPLSSKDRFYKHWENILTKAEKMAIVTDDKNMLFALLNIKILMERWCNFGNGQDICSPENCPAAYIDSASPVDIFKAGAEITDYMKEIFAIKWKTYELQTKLLLGDHSMADRVQKAFEAHDIPYKSDIGFLEFPCFCVILGQTRYEYNLWTGQLSSRTRHGRRIAAEDLIPSAAERDRLAEQQILVYETQKYSVETSSGVIAKKIGEQQFYFAEEFPKFSINKHKAKFNVFYRVLSDSTMAISLDFLHGLSESISGLPYLQLYISQSIGSWTDGPSNSAFLKTITIDSIIFEGKIWKLLDREALPSEVRDFSDGSLVLPLERLDHPKTRKYIIPTFIDQSAHPVCITEEADVLHYGNYAVSNDTLNPDFPKQHLSLKLDEKDFVLVPLENSVHYTSNTPCELFEVKLGSVTVFEIESIFKLTCYYMVHGKYKASMDLLHSVIIASGLKSNENQFLQKVMSISKFGIKDNRPEALAVIFYSAYVYHRSSLFQMEAQELGENPLLKEFFPDKDKKISIAEILSTFYAVLTRVPVAINPVQTIGNTIGTASLLSFEDEVSFIMTYLSSDHHRLAEISGLTSKHFLIPASSGGFSISNRYLEPINLIKIEDWKKEEPFLHLIMGKDGGNYQALKKILHEFIFYKDITEIRRFKALTISVIRSLPLRNPSSGVVEEDMAKFAVFYLYLLENLSKIREFGRYSTTEFNYSSESSIKSKNMLERRLARQLAILEGKNFYNFSENYPDLPIPFDFSETSFEVNRDIKSDPDLQGFYNSLENSKPWSKVVQSNYMILSKSQDSNLTVVSGHFEKLQDVLLRNKIISRPISSNSELEDEAQETNKKLGLHSSLTIKDGMTEKLTVYLRTYFDGLETSHIALEAKLTTLLLTTSDEINMCIMKGQQASRFYNFQSFESLLRPFLLRKKSEYKKQLPLVGFETIEEVHKTMGKLLEVKNLKASVERALSAIRSGVTGRLEEELDDYVAPMHIKDLIAVLEHKLGFKIRRRNVENIFKMVSKTQLGYPQIALQSIMGSGKTEVISPAVSFMKADGNELSLFCPPSTHFETNARKLGSYSRQFFGQDTEIAYFDRSEEKMSPKSLHLMFNQIKQCISNRKNLIMKFEVLQSISNQFIYNLYSKAGEEQTLQLAKVLDLFKKKTNITYDEVDYTYRTNRMFNFPAKPSRDLDQRVINILKLVLKSSSTCYNELKSLNIFPQKGNTQAAPKHRIEVSQIVAKEFLKHLKGSTDLKQFEFDQMFDFLVKEPLGVFNHVEPDMDKLDIKIWIMCQSVIRSLIIDTWGTICNFNYGPSKYCELPIKDDMFCGVAKPFAFAGEPNESSNWANKYETAIKTYQMLLENGFTDKQFKEFISWLRTQALDEANFMIIDNADSKFAKLFDTANFKHSDKLVVLVSSTAPNTITVDIRNQAMIDDLRSQIERTYDPSKMDFILDYVFLVAMAHEDFYESQITNNSQFMATRFKTSQGFSGTAQRKYQFWRNVEFIPDIGSSMSIEVRILSQVGTIFEVQEETDVLSFIKSFYEIDVVLDSDSSLSPSSLSLQGKALYIEDSFDVGSVAVERLTANECKILASSKLKNTLNSFGISSLPNPSFVHYCNDATLKDMFSGAKAKVKAFIDTGAFLRIFSNHEVAVKVLDIFSPFIECVLFYDNENRLSFVKRTDHGTTSNPKQLTSEKYADILSQTGLKPHEMDKIFVYYDQKHILGSDFKMIDGAIAYVTVGPTTTRTDLEQAVMRMRGLLENKQTLRFIVSSEVVRTIQARNGNDAPISLLDVVNHAIINETELFKSLDDSGEVNKQNLQLLYQKIKANYLDLVFTHLVEMIVNNGNFKDAFSMFESLQDWFVQKSYDFELLPDSKIEKTDVVLKAYLNTLHEDIVQNELWKGAVGKREREVFDLCERDIADFVNQGLTETYTTTPISHEMSANTEVQVQNENQNENQNQNQNQNQNEAQIVEESIRACLESTEIPSLGNTLPAFHFMDSTFGAMNRNIFGDRLRITKNLLKVTSEETTFKKVPTFFLWLANTVIAVSHNEVSILKNEKDKTLFYLQGDEIVVIHGESRVSFSEDTLIDLLVFTGDYETLGRNTYEKALQRWASYRKFYFETFPVLLDEYLGQRSAFFKKARAYSVIKTHYNPIEVILTDEDRRYFKKNPRFSLDLCLESSKHLTISELISFKHPSHELRTSADFEGLSRKLKNSGILVSEATKLLVEFKAAPTLFIEMLLVYEEKILLPNLVIVHLLEAQYITHAEQRILKSDARAIVEKLRTLFDTKDLALLKDIYELAKNPVECAVLNIKEVIQLILSLYARTERFTYGIQHFAPLLAMLKIPSDHYCDIIKPVIASGKDFDEIESIFNAKECMHQPGYLHELASIPDVDYRNLGRFCLQTGINIKDCLVFAKKYESLTLLLPVAIEKGVVDVNKFFNRFGPMSVWYPSASQEDIDSILNEHEVLPIPNYLYDLSPIFVAPGILTPNVLIITIMNSLPIQPLVDAFTDKKISAEDTISKILQVKYYVTENSWEPLVNHKVFKNLPESIGKSLAKYGPDVLFIYLLPTEYHRYADNFTDMKSLLPNLLPAFLAAKLAYIPYLLDVLDSSTSAAEVYQNYNRYLLCSPFYAKPEISVELASQVYASPELNDLHKMIMEALQNW